MDICLHNTTTTQKTNLSVAVMRVSRSECLKHRAYIFQLKQHAICKKCRGTEWERMGKRMGKRWKRINRRPIYMSEDSWVWFLLFVVQGLRNTMGPPWSSDSGLGVGWSKDLHGLAPKAVPFSGQDLAGLKGDKQGLVGVDPLALSASEVHPLLSLGAASCLHSK